MTFLTICFPSPINAVVFNSFRDTLNNHIDRKRTQLSQLQRHLSELEGNVHELKSQKVRNIMNWRCYSRPVRDPFPFVVLVVME